jgi:hypothetical protein
VHRKPIYSKINVSELFADISLTYDYDPEDYTHELASLIALWQEQGYIEIYQTDRDQDFGRAKSSQENGRQQTIYQYIGIYHARISKTGDNDPLVVVEFSKDEEDSEKEYADLLFLSDHDKLFGKRDDKNRPNKLRVIRNKADNYIKLCRDAIDRSK